LHNIPIHNYIWAIYSDAPFILASIKAVSPAIPIYDMTSPYQGVAVQYCILYFNSLNGKPEKRYFMAKPGFDERRLFIESFLGHTIEKGNIIIYSATELNYLVELAQWYPEYSEELENRIKRVKIVSKIFNVEKESYPFQKYQFTLRELLTEFHSKQLQKYKRLTVTSDLVASYRYEKMGKVPPTEQMETKWAITEYCFAEAESLKHILDSINDHLKKKAIHHSAIGKNNQVEV